MGPSHSWPVIPISSTSTSFLIITVIAYSVYPFLGHTYMYYRLEEFMSISCLPLLSFTVIKMCARQNERGYDM